MYTQFNTLSFCIDVDDSYTTYLSGFNVNMSVNDSYLLMRTKHVFCFFYCLFKPTLVYHISLKAWFYCILYGSSLWRKFLFESFERVLLFWMNYFIHVEVHWWYSINHLNSRFSTWVELHFFVVNTKSGRDWNFAMMYTWMMNGFAKIQYFQI